MTNFHRDLYAAAFEFWQDYLKQGPGQLTPEDLANFESLRDAWEAGHPDETLMSACSELAELFHRCVHRSEGLSFVTGEAGLIPRMDLHARCEHLLRVLEAR